MSKQSRPLGKVALILACMASTCYARRIRLSSQHLESELSAEWQNFWNRSNGRVSGEGRFDPWRILAILLLVLNPAADFNPSKLGSPTTSSSSAKRSKVSLSMPTILSESIAKPREDEKDYRLIQLQNKMRCLLISDPTLAEEDHLKNEGGDEDGDEHEEHEEEEADSGGKKAACAMCLGVGSLSDPPSIGGLAHFVEHMVFMGTEKFPTENEWSSYLAECGGEDNGETDFETTTCYFDVVPAHLQQTLRRFACFYACPLLHMESAQREVQAIESEYQQAKMDDECRFSQLLCHLAGPGSPYHGFGWGNQHSLQELPAAAGTDMHSALVDFHRKYYSAELMTLVVLGQEPLDVLQDWVVEAFQETPNLNISRPEFAHYPLPFAHPSEKSSEAVDISSSVEAQVQPPLWIQFVPLKEKRRLELRWYVPSLLSSHRAKPDAYISHLLGHEARGSVLDVLKEEGLAASLWADIDDEEHTSLCANFVVQVELTPSGLQNSDRVVQIILSGLGMLARSPPERWIFEELRDASVLNFEHLEAEQEIDYVRRLAISMQRPNVEPDETLSSEYLISEFMPTAIQDLLSKLTPDNLIATLWHKEAADAGPADGSNSLAKDDIAVEAQPLDWHEEPWFGAKYATSAVTGPQLEAWERAYAGAETSISGRLSLPPRNQYIPTDFSLRNTRTPNAEFEPPILILASEHEQLFYKPDITFGTPKVVMCLQIEFSRPATAADNSRTVALKQVLNLVATRVVLELINSDLYAATLADFSYDLKVTDQGAWYLEVQGFAHKFDRVLRTVCKGIRSLADGGAHGGCDELTLKRVLTQFELGFRNAGYDPSNLAITERLRCLLPDWISPEEKLAVLPEITTQMLSAHVAGLLSQGVRLVAYVGGNVARQEALDLFSIARSTIGAPAMLDVPAMSSCAMLQHAHSVHNVLGKNPADQNSAIDLYWQLGPENPTEEGKVALLEHLMYEPLFDALRTKQQIGYTVSCSERNTRGVLGFLISIVSATHTPQDVEVRALEFLKTFTAGLHSMKPSDYAANVDAAIANELIADKSINDEAERYWSEIDTRQYRFKRAQEKSAAMREIAQAEFARWAEDVLLSNTAKRLSVVVNAHVGPAAADNNLTGWEQQSGAVAIQDPAEYKAMLELHVSSEQPLPMISE